MSSNKELLIKGEPNNDESFEGFILRLTQWNYYETPLRILSGAGFNRGHLDSGCSFLFRETVDLSHLARLTGVDTDKLAALTYPPVTQVASPTHFIFGCAVPKGLIRVRFAKVCSLCLSESNYCRRTWDLAAVTACPVHRILLLDQCPNCNKRITWVRNKISICRCDFDWREASIIPASQAELGMSQHIYQLLGLTTDSAPALHNLSGSPLLALDLMHFLTAVYFIAGQYKGTTDSNGKYFTVMRNSELHSLLTKAFSAFYNWPESYYEFLDWRRAQKPSVQRFTGLERDFGSFYKGLYLRLDSEKFGFMKEEFERYLHSRWDGGSISDCKRFNKSSRFNKKYITKIEAVRLMEYHSSGIDRLIEIGKLKAIEHYQGKKKQFLIEVDSVLEMRLKIKQSLSLASAAESLGISTRLVMDLFRQGYLEAISGHAIDGSLYWRFSPEAIKEFLAKIKKMVSSPASLETLPKVGFTAHSGCWYAAILLLEIFFRPLSMGKLTLMEIKRA